MRVFRCIDIATTFQPITTGKDDAIDELVIDVTIPLTQAARFGDAIDELAIDGTTLSLFDRPKGGRVDELVIDKMRFVQNSGPIANN